MITEFDIPLSRLADLYNQEGWYPAKKPGDMVTDSEEKIREVISELLEHVNKRYGPEHDDTYQVETMRLRIERFEDYASIYLKIGTVTW